MLLGLTLLSYLSLDPLWQALLALGGLVLPTLWVLGQVPLKDPILLRESVPESRGRSFILFFLLVAAAGSCIRLFHLTDLCAWPSLDEGLGASFSMDLLRHWEWRFFFYFSQAPCAFIWLQAAFFKLLGPSLSTLWLLPALLSILALGVSYAAGRMFFPRAYALVLSTLLAFSFWHLFAGRYAVFGALHDLWEILALGVLGGVVQNREGRWKNLGAYGLGFLTGSGLFISHAWPAFMAPVAWALFRNSVQGVPDLFRGLFGRFLAALLPFLFLFAGVGLSEHYGGYIQGLWSLGRGFHAGEWLSGAGAYLAVVFARPQPPLCDYFAWGNLLNPLEGALFITGLVELVRLRRVPWSQWLGASLFLAFLPALLSKGFEANRIINFFPLALVVCAIGLGALVEKLSPGRKTTALVLLLALSSVWNIYHLLGPFHQVLGVPNPHWQVEKSEPFYRAYQILERDDAPLGPGAVLLNLWAQSSDETLALATFPLNAELNPRIPDGEIKWVAVFLEADYKPFLAARFPRGRWYWLGPPYAGHEGGLMLGVVPVEDSNREILLGWLRADRALQPVTSEVLQYPPWFTAPSVFNLLKGSYGAMAGDPFLRTCYWDKVYTRQAVNHSQAEMLGALQEGLKTGYPLAHLYNAEGLVLMDLGRKDEAEKAFRKAAQSPVNFTSAAKSLEALRSPGGGK